MTVIDKTCKTANRQTKESMGLKPGVFIKTFGCQMNEYDSEKVLALLSGDHREASSIEDAEVIFINTCSVRDKAEHKLMSLLGKLREVKNANPKTVIGVGGCVAQQEGISIIKKNPTVDFVVGTHNLSLVPSLVQAAKNGSKNQVVIDYREDWEDLPDSFAPLPLSEKVRTDTKLFSPVRALVAIQRGCNKNCSYCVVPNTRGPEVSRSPEEIEREVRLKVRMGAVEVMLLGQTVNSYGRDLSPRFPFENLIRRLAKIEGLARIRFTSPHPQEVRPAFIELFKEVPKLCHHIHLPLQSGSDRILKLMNRNYRTKRYLDIVESLRKQCPDIAISSDMIVGYPTETEDDFTKTLEIMHEVQYCSSFSFKYSRRPFTQDSRQLSIEDEVTPMIAQERLLRLQALQDKISVNLHSKKIGHIVEVLVEGHSKHISSLMRGRNFQHSLVELTGGSPSPGDIVDATVEHASAHGLRGAIYHKNSG